MSWSKQSRNRERKKVGKEGEEEGGFRKYLIRLSSLLVSSFVLCTDACTHAWM